MARDILATSPRSLCGHPATFRAGLSWPAFVVAKIVCHRRCQHHARGDGQHGPRPAACQPLRSLGRVQNDRQRSTSSAAFFWQPIGTPPATVLVSFEKAGKVAASRKLSDTASVVLGLDSARALTMPFHSISLTSGARVGSEICDGRPVGTALGQTLVYEWEVAPTQTRPEDPSQGSCKLKHVGRKLLQFTLVCSAPANVPWTFSWQTTNRRFASSLKSLRNCEFFTLTPYGSSGFPA